MISQIIWEIGDAADLIWFLGDFSPRNHTILGDLGFYPPLWFLAEKSARNHQCELGSSARRANLCVCKEGPTEFETSWLQANSFSKELTNNYW